MPFSPLGRGFLSGTVTRKDDLPEGDARRNLPRFSAEAIDANLRVVEALKVIADEKGVTTAQLALAWLIQAGTVPIPGTTKASRVKKMSPLLTWCSPRAISTAFEATSPHGVAVGTAGPTCGTQEVPRVAAAVRQTILQRTSCGTDWTSCR